MKKDEALVVKTGEYKISTNPGCLIAMGLGSCVVVTIYCEKEKIGGMIHFLLPENPDSRKTAKYADSGIKELVNKLSVRGVEKTTLKAKIIGGAVMFKKLLDEGKEPIGNRNVRKARNVLKVMGISIEGEDVGGNHGRSVEFDLSDGEVKVRSYAAGEKVI